MQISTKEDYWKAVDDNWDAILNIFLKVHVPLTEPYEHGDLTTNYMPMLAYLIKLKDERNPEIARWFNLAWAAAPDNPIIHDWYCWVLLLIFISRSSTNS
jgi:hypothetical protein